MRKTRRSLQRMILCATVALVFVITGCGSTAAVSGKDSGEQGRDAQADGTQDNGVQDNGAQTTDGTQDSGMSVTVSVTEVQELPEYSWQLAASFPDWKGSPDNSLAMNSMTGFEGRHGQGRFYVVPSEGITSFSLYVNDVPVDTSGIEAGKVCEVDYSAIALDGVNSVQVTDILPIAPGAKASGENATEEKVSIYAAYPEVLPGTLEEAGISKDAAELVSDIIESDIRNGFTSAQLAVIRHGRLVYENAWGSINSY